MPIQFDKFDQQKVDNLKTHLDSAAKRGTPKTYEIHVDGVKAVMKTDDPSEFENYEAYLKEDTNEIKIIIYGSNNSPRNDQYAFSLKAKSQKEALDLSLDGLATKAYTNSEIREMMEKRHKQIQDNEELEMLRIKVTDLELKLKEAKEENETMVKIIEKARENGNKIGGIHAGELLSVALEGILKRNAPSLARAAGLEGLAGALEAENANPTQENQETSFRKKEATNSAELTEHEKEFVILFHELEKCFTGEEMLQIIGILHNLAKDKTKLAQILELLDESQD